MEYYEVEVD